MANPGRRTTGRSRRRRRRRKGPGLYVLVNKGTRKLKSGKSRVRYTYSVPFLAIDLDMRPLVEAGVEAVIAHHTEAVEAGDRPNQGKLPKLRASSLRRRPNESRLHDRVMAKTGSTYRRATPLKMRGGTFRATQTIKPFVEDRQHAIVLNKAAKRGVPLFSNRGKAKKAFEKAVTAYLRTHAVVKR